VAGDLTASWGKRYLFFCIFNGSKWNFVGN